jgi:hypothetical protein
VVAAFLVIVLLQAYFGCAGNYRLPSMTDLRFTELKARDCRRISGGVSALCFVAFALIHVVIVHQVQRSNGIPAFWRSVHLLSGVSPLLPQLFLFAGMYCWFWFSLRGLSLFGDDRPVLPGKNELILKDEKQSHVMPMFSFEQAQLPAENGAMPIGKQYLLLLGLIFPILAIICTVVLQGAWLRTLGELFFGRYVFFLANALRRDDPCRHGAILDDLVTTPGAAASSRSPAGAPHVVCAAGAFLALGVGDERECVDGAVLACLAANRSFKTSAKSGCCMEAVRGG